MMTGWLEQELTLDRSGSTPGGCDKARSCRRCCAPAPHVLLLDEPFTAVDAESERVLREWLRVLSLAEAAFFSPLTRWIWCGTRRPLLAIGRRTDGGGRHKQVDSRAAGCKGRNSKMMLVVRRVFHLFVAAETIVSRTSGTTGCFGSFAPSSYKRFFAALHIESAGSRPFTLSTSHSRGGSCGE